MDSGVELDARCGAWRSNCPSRTVLELPDARARLRAMGEYLGNKYGLSITWTGDDEASVTGSYLVVSVSGGLHLTASSVTFSGKDPGMLWRGKAKDYLTRKSREVPRRGRRRSTRSRGVERRDDRVRPSRSTPGAARRPHPPAGPPSGEFRLDFEDRRAHAIQVLAPEVLFRGERVVRRAAELQVIGRIRTSEGVGLPVVDFEPRGLAASHAAIVDICAPRAVTRPDRAPHTP